MSGRHTHRAAHAIIYAVDDGHGNELATGLDGSTPEKMGIVERTARSIADARGETVYLYTGSEPSIAIEPSEVSS